MDSGTDRERNRAGRLAGAFFILCLALEILALTYGFGRFDPYLNPVIWFVGSLGASVSGYVWLSNRRTGPNGRQLNPGSLTPWINALALIILAGGSLYIGRGVWMTVSAKPLDPAVSDIVPSLQHYVHRLLSGEQVYAPIAYDTWTVFPNYLPLTWLPYVPAEWLHLDYRFYSYLVLVLILFAVVLSQGIRDPWLLPKCVFLVVLLRLVTLFHSEAYIHAVEFTIAGTYLLLARSLLTRSAWWIGTALLCCLLSRYSFTFWLPVFLLTAWYGLGRKFTIRSAVILAIGTLLIYGPFLLSAPHAFMAGLEYYGKVVESLWHPYYWQQAGEMPFHMDKGLSFSIWFYRFAPGDVLNRLHWNQWVHLILCAVSAVAILFGYFKLKDRKNFRFGIFALCSLNAYLAVFYGFLYSPFGYLFIVPLFAKLPILLVAGNRTPSNQV